MADKLYVGKAKIVGTKYGDLMNVSICYDDIPEEHLSEAKNGKRYLRLTVSKMREPDKYGNTHTVVVDTWKPEKGGRKPATPAKSYGSRRSAGPEDFDDDIPF